MSVYSDSPNDLRPITHEISTFHAGKSTQQSRRWRLTLPADEYDEQFVRRTLAQFKAVVGQLEEGTHTGYRHWELYIEHSSPVRRSRLSKLMPKGHFLKAKSSRLRCVRYCTKETSFAGVRIEMGELDLSVKQGKRTDLDAYADQILLQGLSADDVMWTFPRASMYEKQLRTLELVRDRKQFGSTFRDMKVHYLHGGTRTGKTSAVYETYGYDEVFRVSNWKNPFDGYKGQRVLVLDEYNTSLRVAELLKILEGYPLEVSARYADKFAKFTEVFIISNLRLREQHIELRQKHPEQWKAFLARLTSVSEMTLSCDDDGNPHTATLLVESGTPPKLDHFLTQKPVEFGVAEPDNRPDMPSLAVASDDTFDDFDDFGDEDPDTLFD